MNPSLISAINRSRNGSRDKGCFLGISLAVSSTYQISISRRVLQNEYHPKIPSLLFPPHLPFRRQQVFAFLPVCCHFPVHLYKRKPSYLWHQGNDMANFVVFTMESPPPPPSNGLQTCRFKITVPLISINLNTASWQNGPCFLFLLQLCYESHPDCSLTPHLYLKKFKLFSTLSSLKLQPSMSMN